MSTDNINQIWQQVKKQGQDDLPPTETVDEEKEPTAAVDSPIRCLRCGTITTSDKCTGCGFCIGCEGGCSIG